MVCTTPRSWRRDVERQMRLTPNTRFAAARGETRKSVTEKETIVATYYYDDPRSVCAEPGRQSMVIKPSSKPVMKERASNAAEWMAAISGDKRSLHKKEPAFEEVDGSEFAAFAARERQHLLDLGIDESEEDMNAEINRRWELRGGRSAKIDSSSKSVVAKSNLETKSNVEKSEKEPTLHLLDIVLSDTQANMLGLKFMGSIKGKYLYIEEENASFNVIMVHGDKTAALKKISKPEYKNCCVATYDGRGIIRILVKNTVVRQEFTLPHKFAGRIEIYDGDGKLLRQEYAPTHELHGCIDFFDEHDIIVRREYAPTHMWYGRIKHIEGGKVVRFGYTTPSHPWYKMWRRVCRCFRAIGRFSLCLRQIAAVVTQSRAARKRWQRAICRVIKLEQHYKAQTVIHRAEFEERRRVREACKKVKEFKAKDWAPSIMPGIRPAVRKWVKEDAGESARARARGKKLEALESRKESIRKQLEAYNAKMIKQAKEQAERDRLREVGFAIMHNDRGAAHATAAWVGGGVG